MIGFEPSASRGNSSGKSRTASCFEGSNVGMFSATAVCGAVYTGPEVRRTSEERPWFGRLIVGDNPGRSRVASVDGHGR